MCVVVVAATAADDAADAVCLPSTKSVDDEHALRNIKIFMFNRYDVWIGEDVSTYDMILSIRTLYIIYTMCIDSDRESSRVNMVANFVIFQLY